MSMWSKKGDEIRIKVAKIAVSKWKESKNPMCPFGFSFLGWSFEVHIELQKNHPNLGVYLQVYRVQTDGRLMLWIKDMRVA